MRILGIYILIVNIIAFVMYGIDKSKAIHGQWRIPEATLIGIAALGGGLGALLGMLVWHHKTKKWKFRILVPALLILWIVAGYIIFTGYPAFMPGPFISGEPAPEAAKTENGGPNELDNPKNVRNTEADGTESDLDKADQNGPTELESTQTEQSENVDTIDLTTDFDITLAFAGDINFDDTWSVMAHYHELGDDLEAVIDPKYIDAMRSADVMWINNEFTYSDRGSPLNGKAYTFRSKPENVRLLEEMGVDIVGLANNHVYDYGKEAFLDTLDTLKAVGISYVGAGHDLNEAKSPVYMDVDGVCIAYVAASRAEKYKMTPQATDTEPGILRCYDNTIFLESIREADLKADYVVALPHWGTEYSQVLEPAQTEGAKLYIEAGADAVIGAHTHCLQEITDIDGKPVVYSLGNFWFNEKTLDTMLYEIHLSGTKTKNGVEIEDVTTEALYGVQSGCKTMINQK